MKILQKYMTMIQTFGKRPRMKHKLSISVSEETIIKIREGMRKGLFRNKSHAFEYAVQEVMK